MAPGSYRDSVLRYGCVVFSHFIAINAAVGYATGDDRVVSFRPDNALSPFWKLGKIA